jgi:predicted site-specific integrase-resolvase
MQHIAIEVLENDIEELRHEFNKQNVEVDVVRSNGFDASSTATLIVELSPVVAGLVATLYGIRKRSEKNIKLKHRGIEITGVSEASLLKILERIEKLND